MTELALIQLSAHVYARAGDERDDVRSSARDVGVVLDWSAVRLGPDRRPHLVVAALVAIVASASVYAGIDSDTSPSDQPPATSLISTSVTSTVESKAPSTEIFTADLKADVYRPTGAGPHPTVMLVHGGGLWTGSRSDIQLVLLTKSYK